MDSSVAMEPEAMLVILEPGPNLASPKKSRSPLRQTKSGLLPPAEQRLGLLIARMFCSTRLRSLHAAASLSPEAFQTPWLA
jgi:hypothetical protein